MKYRVTQHINPRHSHLVSAYRCKMEFPDNTYYLRIASDGHVAGDGWRVYGAGRADFKAYTDDFDAYYRGDWEGKRPFLDNLYTDYSEEGLMSIIERPT